MKKNIILLTISFLLNGCFPLSPPIIVFGSTKFTVENKKEKLLKIAQDIEQYKKKHGHYPNEKYKHNQLNIRKDESIDSFLWRSFPRTSDIFYGDYIYHKAGINIPNALYFATRKTHISCLSITMEGCNIYIYIYIYDLNNKEWVVVDTSEYEVFFHTHWFK